MKVALISDVHTNLAAWDALVYHWQTQAIDFEQAWSLGDWLGYGNHHPMHLWSRLTDGGHPGLKSLLSDPSSHGVLGNHDLGILNSVILECGFNDHAWSVIRRQQAYVESSRVWMTEFAPWLSNQPLLLSPVSGVYLAHGAFCLDNPYQIPCTYVPYTRTHEDSFEQIHAWLGNGLSLPDSVGVALEGWHAPMILIAGHTHQQRVWQRSAHLADDGRWLNPDDSYPSIEKIRHCVEHKEALEHVVKVKDLSVRRPVWINPGSVGEQRDLQELRPGDNWQWAKYAILEWNGPSSHQAVISLWWVPYQRPSTGN